MFKFDFFAIRRGLNRNDKKTTKAIKQALDAAETLAKVNNSLVTMQEDADDRAKKYAEVSNTAKTKREKNSAMIDVLMQVSGAEAGK